MTLFKICLVSLIFFSVAQAGDWPQWRGPNHNGVTHETLALTTDSKLQIRWKKSLGIGGYSSVVVAEGRAYTTFSDSKSDYAICFDAESGDEIWRFRIDDSRPARGNADIGPLATPVVSGDMVYAVSARGSFHALTVAQGKMVWTPTCSETRVEACLNTDSHPRRL
ncbi:PQQ-binding-like beta-propeller repeat protein [candidate division KSB1 bacterium]|nr:PQQ-binding-like beta-propeller repeat protein [candidate division KSB1 bacterium]